jgi:hypothetical protein
MAKFFNTEDTERKDEKTIAWRNGISVSATSVFSVFSVLEVFSSGIDWHN